MNPTSKTSSGILWVKEFGENKEQHKTKHMGLKLDLGAIRALFHMTVYWQDS